MPTLGEAKIKIRAVLDPLKTGLKKARALTATAAKKIAVTAITGVKNAIRGTISTITRAIKNLAKIAAASFIAIGVASVKMAADVEESENLFVVSLGVMGDAVRQWSNEISDALGLNRFEVRKFISVFNNMLKAMGIGVEQAAEMSKSLSLLAFDMASFFNLKPDEAFLKLTAGITGEIEPLKRLGILINETAIKTFALKNGIIAEKEQLSEIQKVLIRFNLINEQTRDAQGDLARTINSTTNVFRTLKSLLSEVLVVLGNELIPIITQLAIAFRDFIRNNQDQIKVWAEQIGVAFTNTILLIRDIITNLTSESLVGKIAEAGIKIGEALGKGISRGLKENNPELFKLIENVAAGAGLLKPEVIRVNPQLLQRDPSTLTPELRREAEFMQQFQTPAVLEHLASIDRKLDRPPAGSFP